MADREKFSLQWNSHLTGESAESFKELVLSSETVLSRLKTIIQDALKAIEAEEIKETSYDVPGWDYKQAFLNGRKAGLKEIDRLL